MARDDKILERRARFVTAALLLAAGCSRDRETGAKPVPSVEVKPVASKEPKPPPVVAAPPDRPSLEAKVSAAAQSHLAVLAKSIDALRDRIARAAKNIPAACSFDDETCRARWQSFADEMAAIEDEAYMLTPPSCPPKTADDKALHALRHEHRAWLDKYVAAVQEAADATAATASGSDAGSVWEAMKQRARAAHAHPCLSLACP